MLLTGTDNIRDVIAFPKTTAAACMMTEAPSFANPTALAELSIQVVKKAEMTDMTQIHEIIRVASRRQLSELP